MRPTEFDYALPRVLKTNVTTPTMTVGKETLYWLPDVILLVESTKVGAVADDELDIGWENTRFVEADAVPGTHGSSGRPGSIPTRTADLTDGSPTIASCPSVRTSRSICEAATG